MAQENESSRESQEEIILLKPTKRKKKKSEASFDPNAWMVTFSDLITLMMTFFVLLFSFNDPNPKELDAISTSAPGLFSLAQSAVSQPIAIQNANSLMKENLEIFLSENSIQNIEVSQTGEGLLITLPTDLTFEKEGAELNEKSRKAIETITRYLNKTKNEIRVEGHTNNLFTPNQRYRDVWDLSLDRAHAVLQEMLKHKISPQRLSLVGKGASQPKFSNSTERGQTVNQRVEIVILGPPSLENP
ncbi:MAG: flagellar motor protein MotB [SAR324 cluster bacterium]|nr:flagellar motor protein MotB [SAR324 cluster bacterium]